MWVLSLDSKKYILSFRSKKADVGKIAKLFGGGGHKFASACSFSSYTFSITDLFYPESLPRNR
jgi:nanoRNase/pAp phosphatase (c-di-AMP/oligoRNAs hydrolase)